MTVKAGTKADLFIAGTAPVAFVDEATTADAGRTTYTITNAVKRLWHDATAVVVERNTGSGFVLVPSSEYRVEYVGGRIVFAVQQPIGTAVRVDGGYLTTAKAGGAHSWSADLGIDVQDTTEFGDEWRRKTTTLKDGSADFDRWWIDSSYLDRLTSGASVIVVLYTDYAAGSRYEALARLASDSVDVATDGVVEESLSFEFTREAQYVPA